jgi:hypothetical protein
MFGVPPLGGFFKLLTKKTTRLKAVLQTAKSKNTDKYTCQFCQCRVTAKPIK